MITWASVKFAQLHAQVAANANTFIYEFDHKPSRRSVADIGPDWLKYSANHADDNEFVFGNLKNGATEAERQLSRAIITYWSNFAKFGSVLVKRK